MTACPAVSTAGNRVGHGSSAGLVPPRLHVGAADRTRAAAMARTLSLHGRVPGAPSLRLQAVQLIHDNIVCICAWCADKNEADCWSRAQGYETTHTICPACRDALAARTLLASRHTA